MKRLFFALFVFAAAGNALAAEPDPIRTGQAISPDGVTIHCAIRGEDDPILVFVHGWCCNGYYWSNQFEHFAPNHRVVTVDMAGHGASHRNRENYTVESFGADVVAVLDEFNLDDVILVGHSMGGAVIVEAALAAPGRIIGLVGVDNFQNVNIDLSPEQITEKVESMGEDFRRSTYKLVQGLFSADADSILVHEVAVDMSTAPSLVALSALEGYLRWSAEKGPDRIKALSAPLVNINSPMYDTDEDAMRALVPDYRLWIMTGVGHFPMLEDPERFNTTLEEAVAYITELQDR
jgi:pimeloyl-ACP methyl ester carboxylesterase